MKKKVPQIVSKTIFNEIGDFPDRMIIIVGGYSKSGKDEFVKQFLRHPKYKDRFDSHTYSDLSKDLIGYFKGITREELEKDKETYREDMKYINEEIIKKNDVFFFPRRLFALVDSLRLGKHIIVTDERHPHSMAYLIKEASRRNMRTLSIRIHRMADDVNLECGFILSEKDFDFSYDNTKKTDMIKGIQEDTLFFHELERHLGEMNG